MQLADFLSAVFFYLKVGENLNQNWIVENCVLNYSTKLQRMFFKKLRENTFILMQMMTRLQRFADVGSLTSTCFLSIGVHAEHFTQQNK